jgi:predicted transposase YbfD/YdcC
MDRFSAVDDPREGWRVLYPLRELLLLVLSAALAGMEDFVEIKLWGEQRLDFLRRFYPYERGVPPHDVLNDLINALDLEVFKARFSAWIEDLREDEPDLIAIDGKTSRRSHDRSKGRAPLHMAPAWASRQRLVLGQEAVDVKSNEIIAIPLLLERLELTDALVTIDAMGTQVKIAENIVRRGGDYLLALKENRPALYADEPRFPHLAMIGMVQSKTQRGGKIEHGRRYYFCSSHLSAERFARAVRAHWHVENRLHWMLDVIFHDDLARLRSGSGPENMAIVKHMALNLIQNPKDRHSLKRRRKLACLNTEYLETIIRQTQALT